MATRAENNQVINSMIGIWTTLSIPVNMMRVEFRNSAAYLTLIFIALHDCIPVTTAFIFSPSVRDTISTILAEYKSWAGRFAAVWTQSIFFVCALIDTRSLSGGFKMFLTKLSSWRNWIAALAAQTRCSPRISKHLAVLLSFLDILFLLEIIGTLQTCNSILAWWILTTSYTQSIFSALFLSAFHAVAIHLKMFLAMLTPWLYWFIAPIAQAKFFFLLSVFFLPSFLMWFHNALHNHIIPLSYDGNDHIFDDLTVV